MLDQNTAIGMYSQNSNQCGLQNILQCCTAKKNQVRARRINRNSNSYRKDEDGHGSNSFYATVRLNFHCIHSHQNYNTIKTYSTAQHAQKTCKQR